MRIVSRLVSALVVFAAIIETVAAQPSGSVPDGAGSGSGSSNDTGVGSGSAQPAGSGTGSNNVVVIAPEEPNKPATSEGMQTLDQVVLGVANRIELNLFSDVGF